MQNLSLQNQRLQARIDAFQDEHGSFIENQSELNRLDLLKKIMKERLKKRKRIRRS